jgi:hypothetical protein
MAKMAKRNGIKALVLGGSGVTSVAFAATINNPGSIEFTGGGDSRISTGSGYNMYTQNASVLGSIDGNGDAYFDLLDISFDAYTDPNGYTTQLQPIDDATGTYCPNSGAATVVMRARIKVTKVNGTPITPCYMASDGGSSFTLTTGTSGSLTGTAFKNASPMFVAEVDIGDGTVTVTGNCSSGQKQAIESYYGLPANNASFLICGAGIVPTNLSGDGC